MFFQKYSKSLNNHIRPYCAEKKQEQEGQNTRILLKLLNSNMLRL
jgi:hypothetical protein